jgi:Zn-finger nucleic acid-binding protein
MLVAEYGSVEIDNCMSCGGIWLDGGELEALTGAELPEAEQDTGLGPPDRDCPVCVDQLIKVRHAATGVIIDRCPHGDGIWFDEGELQQILASYQKTDAPQDHEQHAANALAEFFDGQSPQKQE